ncbi:hypothetical protein IJM86_07285 [bacterium]|nr:hypothetical protein [bacterium]
MVAEGTFDVIEAIVLKKENQGYTKGKTSALKITGKNFSGLNMLTINIDGQNYDAVIDSDYESAYVTDDINIPEGTSKIKVYAELLTTKPKGFSGNITFDNITTDSFTHTGKYEENSEKEFSVAAKMVGTLTMANVEIDGGQVILEKNTTTNLVLNQTKVNGNVFEGTIKNEGSFDLKIDSISLTGKVIFSGYTKADAGNDNIAIALSAGGKAGRTSDKKIAIKDLSGTNNDTTTKTFTFDSPVIVKAGDSVNVSLDVTSAAITMTGANKDEDYMKGIEFQVSVKVMDNENGTEIETPSNTITATVDVKSVKIEKGTSTNKSSIILHKTSKQLIGQGEIQIKNGDAQLKNIEAIISGSSTDDQKKMTSVLVEIDGVNNGTKTYSIVNENDGKSFKTTGISQTISEGYHKVRLYASFGDFEKTA